MWDHALWPHGCHANKKRQRAFPALTPKHLMMPFRTCLPLVLGRIDQPVDLTWLLSRWQRVAPRASDLGASSRVEVLARTRCGRSRSELAFGHGDPHKKLRIRKEACQPEATGLAQRVRLAASAGG